MGRVAHGGRRGTSLIEILIAMSVLAVALIAFLSLIISSNSLSSSSREGSIASYELQSAIEDTFAVTYDEFRTRYPNGYVFPAATYNTLRNENITLTRLAQDPGGSWIEYRVDINYTSHKGRPTRDSITTRRAR
jgi:Tfp pilus assembly protein PilV